MRQCVPGCLSRRVPLLEGLSKTWSSTPSVCRMEQTTTAVPLSPGPHPGLRWCRDKQVLSSHRGGWEEEISRSDLEHRGNIDSAPFLKDARGTPA